MSTSSIKSITGTPTETTSLLSHRDEQGSSHRVAFNTYHTQSPNPPSMTERQVTPEKDSKSLFSRLFCCFGGDTGDAEVTTSVAETTARAPRVEQSQSAPFVPASTPPQLLTHGVTEVSPLIDQHFVSPELLSGRENEEAKVQEALQTIVVCEQKLHTASELLEFYAKDSGISSQEFKEALVQGIPLEKMNIQYSRTELLRKPNQVLSEQKNHITSKYAEGVQVVDELKRAKADVKKHRENIQVQYSTLPEFNEVLLKGLPYKLEIEGETVKTGDLKALDSRVRQMNPAATQDLVGKLSQWATESASIELDENSPALRAQNYLIALANEHPMTLSEGQANELTRKGHKLQPVRGDHQVTLVQSQGGPMIQSTRSMKLIDTQRDEEVQRLQWTETVNVTTGVVTVNVTEIPT